MPLPVIADCYRVTLNWESNDLPSTHNVIHIYCPTGDVTDVRDTLDSHLAQNMFLGLPNIYVLNSMTILKLDGALAGFDFDLTDPIVGDGSEQCNPAVAGVIQFRTVVRGPSGRGRIYLGPLDETACTNGTWVSPLDDIADAWTTFQTELQGSSPACYHVVASYANAESNVIESYRCRPKLGTQRRRQDAVPSGF